MWWSRDSQRGCARLSATSCRLRAGRRREPARRGHPDVRAGADWPQTERLPNCSGEGFIYDRKPEQEFWERLAAGVFEASEVRAREWREKIAQIDLQKLHRALVSSGRQALGPVSSCHDILLIVDRHMENPGADVQRKLISECAVFVGLNEDGQKAVLRRWEGLHRPKFRDFAPYAAYVARLNLTFAIGVSTGVVTTRSTNAIDLEYLFYAPFTMVFTSADRFHETMWPAASGRNTFVHGAELKADLRERYRRQMEGQKVRGVGIHPPRIDDSVITKVFDIHMGAEEPVDRPRERSPRTVDELEPEIQERLKKVWEEIDKRKGG